MTNDEHNGLPPPLVPPECDLRGTPYMATNLIQIFESDLYALSTGDEFKAAFSLWGRSFSQIPAGSLPIDERLLEHLSGSKRWKAVRQMALRGWFQCSDGRLYHRTVADAVLRAWNARISSRQRTEAARAARKSNRTVATEHLASSVTDRVADDVTGSKVSKDKIRIDSGATHLTGEAPVAPPPGDPPPGPPLPATHLATADSPAFDARKALFEEGLSTLARITGRSEKALRAYVGKALSEVKDDAAVVLAIIRECAELERADPLAWVSKAVKERAAPKRKTLEEEMREAIGLGEPPPGVVGVILDHADFEVPE